MSRIVREIPLTQTDVGDDNNKEKYQQEVREEVSRVVSILNLTTSDDVVRATDTKRFLSSEKYALGAFTGDDVRLDSAGGATITIKTSFSNGNYVISNMDFTKGVSLTATALVIFNGCRFQNEVTMVSGAKASFNGCIFEDSGYVNNAGAAPNAGIVGCIKTSTTAHTNVTNVFSV